jgi:hypothetical protein
MEKNYGFVLFFTKNFEEISNNLINSILLFSKYNIEINTINYDYIINNNRIISKKIILDNLSFESIMSAKFISSINTNFDIALILDSDMIVTKDIDNIFLENEDKINNNNFPLFAKHPHKYDPFKNNQCYVNKITNKNPKMPWVYANYLFSGEKHKWFFKEALEIYKKNEYIVDEIIINALLVEYEIDYDLGYNYFPNCHVDIVEYFLDNTHNKGLIEVNEIYYDIPIKFYAFHGHLCKNIEYTKNLIERINNK